MSERTIYFDFDRTLIDTDALKAKQAEHIARIANLTIEQVHEGMRQYIASIGDHLYFNPESYAVFLADLYSIPAGDVMKIYLGETSYFADYVFPEVVSVLTQLKEQQIQLGIFSSAVYEPQLHKLKYSGVLEHFPPESIIIHPRKLTPEIVAKVPHGALVVDDGLDVVTALAQSHVHVIPVWCNRKTDEIHQMIRTIHSLDPLVNWEWN